MLAKGFSKKIPPSGKSMESTRNQQLFEYRRQAVDDEAFITRVNALHSENGSVILQDFFHLFAGVTVAGNRAIDLWAGLQQHRRQLSLKLGRSIDLTTALSDYLHTTTELLKHPRLIEASHYQSVVHETVHDTLTGLFNRAYFDEVYQQQISLAKRYNDDFSILFLDVDDFREINNRYGHAAGDAALKEIAAVISREKRDSDIAARYGGEEFVLLMTHTDNISAFVLAERVRQHIEQLRITHLEQHFALTVSGGIAAFPFNASDPEQLIHLADSAMYLAKGAGKNTICHYKKEKRRYLRVKIRETVLAQELVFHDTPLFSGTSKDICVGGILFENPEPLPLGALIKVKVPVAGGAPVLLIGHVVRVESFTDGGYDIGMTTSFRDLDKILSDEIAGILHGEAGG
jgi:diguanylate cyclase (GGDEF)-like protein